MSKERMSECEEALSFEMLENISFKTQIKELKRTIRWINEDKDWLEKENKLYREAREIIEQVYKENYVRNAYGYEDGYLDGLDTAMSIIDEVSEESE